MTGLQKVSATGMFNTFLPGVNFKQCSCRFRRKASSRISYYNTLLYFCCCHIYCYPRNHLRPSQKLTALLIFWVWVRASTKDRLTLFRGTLLSAPLRLPRRHRPTFQRDRERTTTYQLSGTELPWELSWKIQPWKRCLFYWSEDLIVQSCSLIDIQQLV